MANEKEKTLLSTAKAVLRRVTLVVRDAAETAVFAYFWGTAGVIQVEQNY